MARREDSEWVYGKRKLLQWASVLSGSRCRNFEDLSDGVVLHRLVSKIWSQDGRKHPVKFNPKTPAELRANWRAVAAVLTGVGLPLEELDIALADVEHAKPDPCLGLLLTLFYIRRLTEGLGADMCKLQFDFAISTAVSTYLQSRALVALLHSQGFATQGFSLSPAGSPVAASPLPAQHSASKGTSAAQEAKSAAQAALIEEQEAKIALLQQQVSCLEMQNQLDKQRHAAELESLERRQRGELLLRSRDQERELEVTRVWAAKAKVNLSEEFEARYKELEQSHEGLPGEDLLQETASLRLQCGAQRERIKLMEESKGGLLCEVERLEGLLVKERETVAAVCSELFSAGESGGASWMEELSGEQLAGASALAAKVLELERQVELHREAGAGHKLSEPDTNLDVRLVESPSQSGHRVVTA